MYIYFVLDTIFFEMLVSILDSYLNEWHRSERTESRASCSPPTLGNVQFTLTFFISARNKILPTLTLTITESNAKTYCYFVLCHMTNGAYVWSRQ